MSGIFVGIFLAGVVIALGASAVRGQKIRHFVAPGNGQHAGVAVEVEILPAAFFTRCSRGNGHAVASAYSAGDIAVILAIGRVGIDPGLAAVAGGVGFQFDAEVFPFGNDVARLDGADVHRAADAAFDAA